MNERRQNVRVRPAADYDVRVELIDGMVTVQLSVVDIAIGGMGLLIDQLFADREVGAQLKLRIAFPGVPVFETIGDLRHTEKRAGGKCGVQLGQLTQEETTALRRVVAELQERGHSA